MATVGGNRQEKRKRIMSYFINATIELMEKEGIENLTIRKVAEQAKYNSATLYHYFSNLDELELFASVKCLDEYMQETLIQDRKSTRLNSSHPSSSRMPSSA